MVFLSTYRVSHDLHGDLVHPLGGEQVGLPGDADLTLAGSPPVGGVTYDLGVHNARVH